MLTFLKGGECKAFTLFTQQDLEPFVCHRPLKWTIWLVTIELDALSPILHEICLGTYNNRTFEVRSNDNLLHDFPNAYFCGW